MKLIFYIIPVLVLTFGQISQGQVENRCPYKSVQAPDNRIIREAEDFTITTTDGITRNLYNTLDSGKTVFVDLFFTTCSSCQDYAPVIEEIYLNHGAGLGNIEFWGISNNLFDTNHLIDEYKATYNITNPCAGFQGGGTTAHSIVIEGQNFMGWPSYVVICPDRTMYFNPVYPPTVTGFDPYFASCTATIGVEEGIGNSEKCIFTIYPNPASSEIFLEMKPMAEGQVTVGIFNLLGVKIDEIRLELSFAGSSYKINTNHLIAGTYFLKIYHDGEFAGSNKVLIIR